MSKKERKNKLFVIGLTLFMFLVISVVGAIYISNKSTYNKELSESENYLKIKEITYSQGKVYDELFASLISFYEAIEMKDFDIAFSMLDQEYIVRNNLNKTSFKEKIENTYKFIPFPVLSKYSKLSKDSYICKVDILAKEVVEGDFPESDNNLKETIILNKKNGKWYFTFDKYIGEQKYNIQASTPCFLIKINKIENYLDRKEFSLTVENTTNYSINFWEYFKTVTITDTENNIYWINNNEQTMENEISPEEIKTMNLVFKSKIKNIKKLKFVKAEDASVFEVDIR